MTEDTRATILTLIKDLDTFAFAQIAEAIEFQASDKYRAAKIAEECARVAQECRDDLFGLLAIGMDVEQMLATRGGEAAEGEGGVE